MNTTELNRFKILELLILAKEIKSLTCQPVFTLRNSEGEYLADYKPDFTYRDKTGQKIAEEVKGSKEQHSATRQDYLLRVKWFLSENKDYRFFEVINNRQTEYRLTKNKNDKIILRKVK